MGTFQFSYRTRLYRKAVLGVTCGFALMLSVWVPAFGQYAKRRQVSKGPRAVGLLELAANGKAHLLPVTIMIDGKFYDAGAYKASPVPMALQYETVYEALKSGVSQGLFTVSGALPESTGWVGDGKWRSTADIAADKAHNKAEAAKKAYKAPEDAGGPPKLRRAQPSDEGSSVPAQTAPPSSPSPKSAETKPSTASAGGTTTPADPAQASENTPGRPVLRHQAPSETIHEQTKPGIPDTPLKGSIQLIPAVSDSSGAEPRPYTYQLKPEEEQKFLKTMLAMATNEVRARATQLSAETQTGEKVTSGKTARTKKAAQSSLSPQLQDVQMHAFDLSNSNEPVLVLTATATIPNARIPLQYSTALVAREDIYGELHKVFAQTSDNQHLDVIPKYEFIDAVDADGDGRGELLFRTTQESGTAFDIYAVIGDRLWPLFEGKPGR
jgi:hypothetical protein